MKATIDEITSRLPISNPELLNEIREKSQIKIFEPGDTLMQENSFIRSIPLLLSGSIKVFRESPDGKEILLYYLQPGDSCVSSLLGGLTNDTSKVKAIVEERSEVLLIPVADSNQWVKTYSEWWEFILRLYNKRFEELLNIVNNIAFSKVDERLLALLKRKQSLHANQNEIQVTHQQLAEELGTAREVVSRLLKQLEREGRIRLGRNRITFIKL